MVESIIDRCKRIPIATTKDKKLNLYCPPRDLCFQYSEEFFAMLPKAYNKTHNKEFIIHLYMYEIARSIFGEGLSYNLQKSRRFKIEYFNWQLENSYKSNAPNPLPPIKFESIGFDKVLEIRPANLLEETFKGLIKGDLKDNSLYFDSASYINFKRNFLNGLIDLTWNNRDITNEEVKQWAERELKRTDSDYKTLLRYDCEEYYLHLNGFVHQKVYRAIRKYLLKEEKRLFILIWFTHYKALGIKSPYRPFGLKMPSFYRIFLDFYLGMPNLVKEDLLNWIFLKNKKSKIKVNELWAKYLKIYPIWLLLARDSDRIGRQTKRRLSKLNNLQDVIGMDGEGGEQTLEEIKGQEDYGILENLMKSDILDNPNLTDKEKEIIRFKLDRHTEVEIARKNGVSQPAISKMLKNIRRKLRK